MQQKQLNRDDGTSRTHFRKFADSGIDFPFLSGSAAEDSWIIGTIWGELRVCYSIQTRSSLQFQWQAILRREEEEQQLYQKDLGGVMISIRSWDIN